MRFMSQSRCLGRFSATLMARAAALFACAALGLMMGGCPTTTTPPATTGDVPFLDKNGNSAFNQATPLR